MRTPIGLVFLSLCLSVSASSARKQLTQNASSSGDSRQWPWWPVCLFVEPGAGSLQKMGEELVREAAKLCQVNIVLTPYYVNQISGNVDTLKQDAARTCEQRSGFRKIGAPSASVAVVTKNKSLPRTMCNGGADTVGCGEFSRDPGNLKDTLATIGKFGGVAGPGKAAVSVIAADAPPWELARWTLGVAMMGLPPTGDAMGKGVGTRDQYGGGGNMGSPQWKPNICSEMHAVAYKTQTPFAYADTWKVSDDSRRPMSLITGKFEGNGPVAAATGRAAAPPPPPPASSTEASDVREPGMWNPATKVQNTSGAASVATSPTVPPAEMKLDPSGGHKEKPKSERTPSRVPDGMPALKETQNLDFSKTAGGKKTPGAIGSGSGTGSLMGGPGSGVGTAGGGMNVPPGAGVTDNTGGSGSGATGGRIINDADAGKDNFDKGFFDAKQPKAPGERRRKNARATGIYGTASGGESSGGSVSEPSPETESNIGD